MARGVAPAAALAFLLSSAGDQPGRASHRRSWPSRTTARWCFGRLRRLAGHRGGHGLALAAVRQGRVAADPAPRRTWSSDSKLADVPAYGGPRLPARGRLPGHRRHRPPRCSTSWCRTTWLQRRRRQPGALGAGARRRSRWCSRSARRPTPSWRRRLTQFSLTARLAFLVVGPMVDLKLLRAAGRAPSAAAFAARFAPTTFVVAVLVASLVGVVAAGDARRRQGVLLVLRRRRGAAASAWATSTCATSRSRCGPWLLVSGAILVLLGLLDPARRLARRRAPRRRASRPRPVRTADEPDRDRRPRRTHDHGDHGGPRAAWLLLLPVLAIFLVAPPALGAYSRRARDRRGHRARRRLRRAAAAAGRPGRPSLLSDYVSRAIWDDGRTLEGRTVRAHRLRDGRTRTAAWYLTRLSLTLLRRRRGRHEDHGQGRAVRPAERHLGHRDRPVGARAAERRARRAIPWVKATDDGRGAGAEEPVRVAAQRQALQRPKISRVWLTSS